MRFRFLAVLALSVPCVLNAAEPFVTFTKSNDTQLQLTGSSDTVFYDPDSSEQCNKGVRL